MADLKPKFFESMYSAALKVSRKLSGRTARTTDLVAWGRQALPHYFTKPSSLQHKWLGARLVIAAMDRGAKLDIEGPRGSAKSTYISTIYPLWAACEKLEEYVIIAADTSGQAQKYLEAIATELLNNPWLASKYPEACGEGTTWNKSCIVLRNGVRIEAVGSGKKIRGRRSAQRRPTCIIVDDAEGDDAAYSRVKRTRIRDWFTKAILNLGDENTNYFVGGTRVHAECLTSHLSTMGGWEHKMFKAIITWPERMDLWGEWENVFNALDDRSREQKARAFYDENQVDMDRGAKLLWPEHESLYLLMCKRATDGYSSFESEKQNNPIDPSKCEWGPDYFKNPDIYFDEWPEDMECKTSSLDASKGIQDETADFQAMIDIGLKDGDVYIDSDLSRRPLDQMCCEYVARITLHGSDVAVCEDNQFQELLIDDLEQAARLVNCPVPIDGMTNTQKKILRIRRLGPFITRQRLKFKRNSKGNAILIKQLSEFPHSDHDDGPDALEMAMRKAGELLAGAPEDMVVEQNF